jgi:hypothetical protein
MIFGQKSSFLGKKSSNLCPGKALFWSQTAELSLKYSHLGEISLKYLKAIKKKIKNQCSEAGSRELKT